MARCRTRGQVRTEPHRQQAADLGQRSEATSRTRIPPELPTQLPPHPPWPEGLPASSGPASPTTCPWPLPSHVPVRPRQEPRARAQGRTEERQDWSRESLRARLLPLHPRRTSATCLGAWHSPDSLLTSLAGSLGAAGTLRLALCSFQYSRQCRSCEWMKRHMSQAWAAHTSSSTQSLRRDRGAGSGGRGLGGGPAGAGDTVARGPRSPHGRPLSASMPPPCPQPPGERGIHAYHPSSTP